MYSAQTVSLTHIRNHYQHCFQLEYKCIYALHLIKINCNYHPGPLCSHESKSQ